ncbi:MAG: GNAT family N-acetyltransferase [Blastocatellia bacterium]|nr:GNAT family N-acetyltransferase [Blastocatellia bacterium]
MTLKIKKAEVLDLAAIYKILSLCGEHLATNLGLTHWFPPYPKESIEKNILERDVYLVYKNEEIIGTFTLGITPVANYDLTRWQNPVSKVMYHNRLAILPRMQGNGLGNWCMEQIEAIACQAGCKALRFDAINHPKLLAFYKKLGYQDLGLWQLSDARGQIWDVMLFEKLL